MQNHEQKKKVMKSNKPRFYEQKKLFFSTLSFILWAVLATWLHIGALRKIHKNELNTCFKQYFTTGSYGVGIGRVWCSTLFLLKVLVSCEKCSYFKIVIMIFWKGWWSPTPLKSKIHCFLVGGTSGSSLYFLLNLQLK